MFVKNKMKIGLDIHGVIDRYPNRFKIISKELYYRGHDIHILTGQERTKCENFLSEFEIKYTHFYSIIDFHKDVGTKMWDDDMRGEGWWLAEDVWNRSKGEYAKKVKLDIHLDDNLEYGRFFPETCLFLHIQSDNNVKVFENLIF